MILQLLKVYPYYLPQEIKQTQAAHHLLKLHRVYIQILLRRHGESEWNALNQYTEWCDVNLMKRDENEARAAGRLLTENGIEIDHAFTSVLKMASFTSNVCLNMA